MKRIRYISILVVIVVLTISIGYSAINVSSDIKNITSYVNVESSIRITRFEPATANDDLISSYEYHSPKKIKTNIDLGENEAVTYVIDVTNLGSSEMGIYSITGLPSNLDYELTEYSIGSSLCDEYGKCNLGMTKTFYLTIRYKENGYDSSNTTYNIDLDFEYREMYNVTYINITNNEYPTKVIDGGTLEINFNYGYKDIEVVGAAHYSYESPVLTITNVITDLTISADKYDASELSFSTTLSDYNCETVACALNEIYRRLK